MAVKARHAGLLCLETRRAQAARVRQGLGAFVPSIVRFLVFLLVVGGLGFAAIFALATFVEPQPREITVGVPSSRLAVD